MPIDATFPLGQFDGADTRLARPGKFGKIILLP